MTHTYKQLVFTNHGWARLLERRLAADAVWQTVTAPSHQESMGEGKTKYVRVVQGRLIHVVASWLPHEQRRLAAHGADRAVSTDCTVCQPGLRTRAAGDKRGGCLPDNQPVDDEPDKRGLRHADRRQRRTVRVWLYVIVIHRGR